MGRNKGLPKQLTEKQELLRQQSINTKEEKLADIVAEKDRKIQELRSQKEELERECKLLRGRIFLYMQEKK